MDDGIGPGETTAEDLERAGWSFDQDGKFWWKYEDEAMSFEDACEYYSESLMDD